jgi:anthranilate synthase/aminodeoxychorismate synthase-like glutamine amidotransferase
MILIIDNYDSFTYNLVQYLGELYKGEVRVARNDTISLDRIRELSPKAIVISPGPCTPAEAGISMDVITTFGPKIPVLGVCLGHQSIGAAFGGKVIRAPYLMHGKVSEIHHDGKKIYTGLPNPFIATRYHSLIIERKSCPDCLEITSQTKDGIIMGVRHKKYPIEGVQFHPESILTQDGKTLLKNFLSGIL